MEDGNKDVYLKEVEIKYKLTKVNGNEKFIGEQVTSSQIVAGLFSDLQNELKEKFITINLDVKCKLMCFEVVAIGALNQVYLNTMDVFRTPMLIKAHSAIVVHNHPSGDPNPSQKDVEFTRELQKLANTMGLKFYDHIIIGSDGYFSFLDEGLM